MNDAELIAQFRAGQIAAFNTLVKRWECPIYNFVLRYVGNRDGAFHATIGLRSSDPPERVAIADTTEVSSLDDPITLGEFIVHQQNLIDYTNRLVQTSQNQQRDEVNNTFIRLVGELETQRQQDLLRIDRGLQILYNTL